MYTPISTYRYTLNLYIMRCYRTLALLSVRELQINTPPKLRCHADPRACAAHHAHSLTPKPQLHDCTHTHTFFVFTPPTARICLRARSLLSALFCSRLLFYFAPAFPPPASLMALAIIPAASTAQLSPTFRGG